MLKFKNDFYPLLKLAWPLALTSLMQSSVFFFETIFLAHLDKQNLAAGALVSWLFATIVVIVFGTLSSINILVALKHGAKDNKSIQFIARDGLYVAIMICIPLIIIAWNMSPIFLWFGQSQEIVNLTQSYLHALVWGLIPNFIIVALLEVLVGLGQTRTVMTISLLTEVLAILFSYLLIFGKMGFPKLGIAGAGWGIAINNTISAVGVIIYFYLRKNLRQYLLAIKMIGNKTPSFRWEIVRVGVPMGLMYSVEVGFFFALTLLMGKLGSQYLAANQVAMQYLGLLMSIIFAIAQAITVRMGHLLGAKELLSARMAAFSGIIIADIFIIVTSIIFWLNPGLLIGVDFNTHAAKNAEIVAVVTTLFQVSALFQILEATRISLFGILRSLKDTRFTLIVSIISFWCIALPIGYYLAFIKQYQAQGLWWGMVIGAASSIIMLSIRFQIKMPKWKYQ